MKKGFIISDPKILNGKPVVKGTRISVALILQCLSSGMSKEDILRGYPTLSKEGLGAALDFENGGHLFVVLNEESKGQA